MAHIDILGMSSLMMNNEDEGWGMLSDLVSVREQTAQQEYEFLNRSLRQPISNIIYSVMFSDTILLFTIGQSDDELRCLIVCLLEVFHKAIKKCIPVRAGLSCGKFFFNIEKSMYGGPALIEAYKTGESADWLGIVISETIQKQALGLGLTTKANNLIIPWNIPLKNNVFKPGFVVNWPTSFPNNLLSQPITPEKFYQPFESSFGHWRELSDKIKSKYFNTVLFFNEQLFSGVKMEE